MTGPEHYQEAERLIDRIALYRGEPSCPNDPGVSAITALAQVHATLALAAATALNDATAGLPSLDWTAWGETARTNRHGGEQG